MWQSEVKNSFWKIEPRGSNRADTVVNEFKHAELFLILLHHFWIKSEHMAFVSLFCGFKKVLLYIFIQKYYYNEKPL